MGTALKENMLVLIKSIGSQAFWVTIYSFFFFVAIDPLNLQYFVVRDILAKLAFPILFFVSASYIHARHKKYFIDKFSELNKSDIILMAIILFLGLYWLDYFFLALLLLAIVVLSVIFLFRYDFKHISSLIIFGFGLLINLIFMYWPSWILFYRAWGKWKATVFTLVLVLPTFFLFSSFGLFISLVFVFIYRFLVEYLFGVNIE